MTFGVSLAGSCEMFQEGREKKIPPGLLPLLREHVRTERKAMQEDLITYKMLGFITKLLATPLCNWGGSVWCDRGILHPKHGSFKLSLASLAEWCQSQSRAQQSTSSERNWPVEEVLAGRHGAS